MEKVYEIGCFVENARAVCKMTIVGNVVTVKTKPSLVDKIDLGKSAFTDAVRWIHIVNETRRTTTTTMVEMLEPTRHPYQIQYRQLLQLRMLQ